MRTRSRHAISILIAAAALAIAGCGSSSSDTSSRGTATQPTTAQTSSPTKLNGSPGFEGIPLENGPPLAPASTTPPGTTVDGIQCAPTEQLVYHIHARLQVYVDGHPRSVPGGIGLVTPAPQQTANGLAYAATQCYYWLHTHASDGVIHIESPIQRIYRLGNFFDEWGQRLSSDQVAGAKGPVTAFINGARWKKSPRKIPLLPHAVIQLDVGSPVVPFTTVSWNGTNL